MVCHRGRVRGRHRRLSGRGIGDHRMGITNQRETTAVGDRQQAPRLPTQSFGRTGALHRCATLSRTADTRMPLPRRPGYCIPFSAPVPDFRYVRARASKQLELVFGTIDTFLLWRLTGGQGRHGCDQRIADHVIHIHDQAWTPPFGPSRRSRRVAARCSRSAGDSARRIPSVWRAIPIRGVAGDQHAGLVGQASLNPV